jgi:hypothetical protein
VATILVALRLEFSAFFSEDQVASISDHLLWNVQILLVQKDRAEQLMQKEQPPAGVMKIDFVN